MDQEVYLGIYKEEIIEAIQDLDNCSGSSSTKIKERIREMYPSLAWNDSLYRTALEPGEGAGEFIKVESYKLSQKDNLLGIYYYTPLIFF
mmetsp:Transcript_38497/g.75198  ORF Transcript_38497/g.75198 Transcript_38497/m.75198 type:complete len:90 (-) Transcript_38497:327-596(-)